MVVILESGKPLTYVIRVGGWRPTAPDFAVGCGTALAVAVTVGVLQWPPLLVIAGAALGLVICAARAPHLTSVGLLLAALPLCRPFLLSEQYAAEGAALACAAAAVAWAADQQETSLPRLARSDRAALWWCCALWAWIAAQLVVIHAGTAEDVVKSIVTVPLVLAAAVLVLRHPRRRTAVALGLVAACVVLCGSFVITFGLWRAAGYGAFHLGALPAGYETVPTQLYAPFTTTYGALTYHGVQVPRFLGVGRESGIMACFLGWAYFALPVLGRRWNRWPVKALLVAGILGTQSTAGVGVFLVVWAGRFLVRRHPGRYLVGDLGRQALGLILVGVAGWLAVVAPALGVQARNGVNAASVDIRRDATILGLHSALAHPLGQTLASNDQTLAGVNLVAALTVLGIPGVVCGLALMLRPLMLAANRGGSVPAVVVVFLTMLTSQPLAHSVGLMALIALSCGLVRSGQAEPEGAAGQPGGFERGYKQHAGRAT